jgi:FK506-binding protein 1
VVQDDDLGALNGVGSVLFRTRSTTATTGTSTTTATTSSLSSSSRTGTDGKERAEFHLRKECNLVSAEFGRSGGTTTTTLQESMKRSSSSSSSLSPSTPLEFEIGKGDVIRGLEIAVQRLVPGQIVEVVCPYLYGYGDRGHPPQIPPRTTLCLVIELLDIVVKEDINNNNKKRNNIKATPTKTANANATTSSWWGWSWW